jgi:DNA-binding CsgD family transcriptional regulator
MPARVPVGADCPLSVRELRVMRLVALGLSTARIAGVLERDPSGVREAKRSARRRLGVSRDGEAVDALVAAGWLPPRERLWSAAERYLAGFDALLAGGDDSAARDLCNDALADLLPR